MWGPLIDILLGHSEALAVTGFGLYIAYEIRLGAIREVRANQRVLGVGLYRVIKRDESLDEEAFRKALWDGGGKAVLYRDLSVNGTEEDRPEDYHQKPGGD